jgi:hypothetical protein
MDNAGKRAEQISEEITTNIVNTIKNHDTYLSIVKAYDTVNREMLWKILTTLGYQKA